MSERQSSRPKLKKETVAGKAARNDRLVAEMRKNLMKRKRQQRDMTDMSKDEARDGSGPEDRS